MLLIHAQFLKSQIAFCHPSSGFVWFNKHGVAHGQNDLDVGDRPGVDFQLPPVEWLTGFTKLRLLPKQSLFRGALRLASTALDFWTLGYGTSINDHLPGDYTMAVCALSAETIEQLTEATLVNVEDRFLLCEEKSE